MAEKNIKTEERLVTKIRVLVVDDSAVVRQVMSAVLGTDPEIKVIATAADPIFALAKMQVEWPDVITLDVEMPRMDGLTFLRRIMAEHPTPVVVCSTLTEAGSKTALEALEAGAVEVIAKPKMGLHEYLTESAAALIQVVKAAARANPRRLAAMSARSVTIPPKLSADVILPPISSRHPAYRGTERLVAIGTSTGGTQALEVVLRALPREVPGIVIVQHMPERFTNAFAARLDSLCALEVREACDGDRVAAGRALIAPGGRHMLVVAAATGGYQVEVRDGPPVSRHRPSVNVLFRSVARVAGANALGVIMTGMGDDGAVGLLEMHQTGARTVAQDEATCVVYGMPKEAVALGAVDRILPLTNIPYAIIESGGGKYK
ncbi:protein-glutamate methylesterase/protein glutamine deamidase [Gammaproteobacteria bacterium]